jgi:hypothetical protein
LIERIENPMQAIGFLSYIDAFLKRRTELETAFEDWKRRILNGFFRGDHSLTAEQKRGGALQADRPQGKGGNA